MEIDVCIVAARRPSLLRRTLASFQESLLANFRVRRAIVNIDPIFGCERDHDEALRIVTEAWPNADVSCPPTANFCAAVQTTWTRTTADFVLHLEDDWLLNEPIYPSILDAFENKRVGQIAFLHKEKNWSLARRGHAHYRRKNLTVSGLRTPIRYKVPGFTTSPSFLRGTFARKVAPLLDMSLDPEKQFYESANLNLEKFVSPYLCWLYGTDGREVITDIGRDWRQRHNIDKKTEGAASYWIFGTENQ